MFLFINKRSEWVKWGLETWLLVEEVDKLGNKHHKKVNAKSVFKYVNCLVNF